MVEQLPLPPETIRVVHLDGMSVEQFLADMLPDPEEPESDPRVQFVATVLGDAY